MRMKTEDLFRTDTEYCTVYIAYYFLKIASETGLIPQS